MNASIYELIAPVLGSATVSVTFSEGAYGGAGSSSYTGVHQTVPSDAATSTAGASTSVVLVISSGSDDMVTDCVKHFSGVGEASAAAGQTQRWYADDGTFNENAGASDETGTTSVSMSWVGLLGDSWVHIASNINAAAAAAGINVDQWYRPASYPERLTKDVVSY
jgi:hypothetical protein